MGTLRTVARIKKHIANAIDEQYSVNFEEVSYRLAYPFEFDVYHPLKYNRARDEIIGWRFK